MRPGAVHGCGRRGGRDTLPEDSIHLERFAAEPAAADAGNADAGAGPAADGFEVRLQRSGQSVRVTPDTSIVDALARIGIEVDTSCGEGVCGTCMVPVIDGGRPSRPLPQQGRAREQHGDLLLRVACALRGARA